MKREEDTTTTAPRRGVFYSVKKAIAKLLFARDKSSQSTEDYGDRISRSSSSSSIDSVESIHGFDVDDDFSGSSSSDLSRGISSSSVSKIRFSRVPI